MPDDSSKFHDEVHATITVDDAGTVAIQPSGTLFLKRRGYLSWNCDSERTREWRVDFTKDEATRGPFRNPNTLDVKGAKGQRRGDEIGIHANKGGKPADPAKPDGPRGRYSYTIFVTMDDGTTHDLDPDVVIGPPERGGGT